MVSEQDIWCALQEVADPEIPVVNIVELGVVQEVRLEGDRAEVVLIPTFSGCPAMELMRSEVENRLRQLGLSEVVVRLSLSPPWSTDRIAPAAREKMKRWGLAPPSDWGPEQDLLQPVTCPYCGSKQTRLDSPFGPTLCRALYYCDSCQQPFEKFKALK
ncbi:MAG: phenylacetate-CoA oxygenase subunit PaaJ [Bacteroidetes bacterium]|nr:phenylacetate-CoA oxygenase subunit PaaJ [Rhodothermia bacterium]MCX7907470.1 phenylacetate-CoA oxygenase subunit PaaJ [Bacteroidota bacterium]MDW8284599.1 1,2-phenylacetyl-CoA epoxidase subunit PaaD [Bacteroidota bacterium]